MLRELLLCEASTVYKYMQEDGSNRGTYGKLVCTNFKISFLDDDSASDDNEPQFKNKIVGENDITLQCVDQIYGVYDEKKKLLTGQLRKYPEKLIIYCKDLRVFNFCLRYTKEEEVKRIVSGIVHHSQTPKLLKRLFLFSYASAAPNNTDGGNQTVMFETLEDWRDELERTKGNVKYKAVTTNEGYRVSEKIYKTISKPPYELLKMDDLSSSLPSLQDIQIAYTRFKQLFLIDNSTDFWATDQSTSGESLKTQSGPFRFLTVWDWSVQFDPKAQAFLNNPLYAEKPKPDKSQRKTARFKHQRQLSLPLTQAKPSTKRGFFREETDHLIKNILGKRIGKFINSSDEPPNSLREFYDSWHSKPVDYHGLLLPRIDGPEIKVWAQRYLRWIPEAQLHGGGTIATAAKILDLMEEVQSLQRQSVKPALPTSTWKDLEDEDDLVKRDDEFVDLTLHQISSLIQITPWGCKGNKRSRLFEDAPLTWQPPAGAEWNHASRIRSAFFALVQNLVLLSCSEQWEIPLLGFSHRGLKV
ncbi:hypothetical protein IHE44_0011643 [Lamprotornis superbus]|uniref:Myotubularin-related protein 12 n=1 Tax=Lamprotornis superbus TaxID=245042 RepID=A0A835NGN3_9PASS|nr:hypothetical protein IHE44_0011643 [Lamprotornis superbus]